MQNLFLTAECANSRLPADYLEFKAGVGWVWEWECCLMAVQSP